MLKKINLLLLSICLFLCSCSSRRSLIILGERFTSFNEQILSTLNEELEVDIDDQFVSSSFTMKKFYSQLEKNALNLVTSKKLIPSIKKADEILINIGNYELLRFLNIELNKFTYNEEVIKTNLEMFDYYFHNTLDILTSYTDDIYVLPLFNCLILDEKAEELLNQLIHQYNGVILQNCDEFKVKYINITSLSKFIYKDYYITESGVSYLVRKIIELHGN